MLHRHQELWTYGVMSAMLARLQESRNTTGGNIDVRPNTSAPPQINKNTNVRQRCWDHVWTELSTQILSVMEHRLGRIGGRRENSGIIYLCAGFGGLVATRKKGHSFRAGWFPQNQVRDAAASSTTNFTIFFLTFHDEDVYIKTRKSVRDRTELLLLLKEFPNLFLMHYSPSLVMPHGAGASFLGDRDPFYTNNTSVLTGAPRVVGGLYPRMIPVPHAPSQHSETSKLQLNTTFMLGLQHVTQRVPLVMWRGATTGYPLRQHAAAYSPSKAHKVVATKYPITDRYRMVLGFNDPSKRASRFAWADVAFSGFCQHVTAAVVPRHAGKIGVRDMMNFRVHLDVDGNTNSWEGLRWRLLFGMAVVKVESSHGFTQWYYKQLRNGTHLIHVPVGSVVSAAKALLDDVGLAQALADAAKEFGRQYLTLKALEEAVVSSVRDAWRIGYDDQAKWCIAPC